jgi:hypothetical protein
VSFLYTLKEVGIQYEANKQEVGKPLTSPVAGRGLCLEQISDLVYVRMIYVLNLTCRFLHLLPAIVKMDVKRENLSVAVSG